ncbi:hypothetical protein EUX98_g8285 [Antrodiella citrinella]|uniref:CsbD-like domain-containing protein n=1 Tax=Antrodiella citrinella TaxID=2447956 RepID=A0A4S4M8Q9_9APHY|nr:hypothetical protein EUX98_g8285 [Antrodiella citrinella]
MSGVDSSTFTTQPPPSHHVHRDSEILPGGKGAEFQAAPYDTSVTNDSQTWKSNNEKRFGAGTDTGNVVAGGQHSTIPSSSLGEENPSFRHGGTGTLPASTHDAPREERPLGVQPTSQGGVAVGGNSDLPEGHASVMDKVIGKTQKVAGKVLRKPEMHEKGELREAGGKEAALGNARAPHD